MYENNYTNEYKFVLKQEDDVIVEKIFNGDTINPFIRNTVDIRDYIPTIIKNITNIATSRSLTLNSHGYELMDEYTDHLNSFPHVTGLNNKLSKPKVIKKYNDTKTIVGTVLKFGLYINNNTIVEREFLVDNYNPKCRFSIEIVEVVNDICENIEESLKERDVNMLWEDYDLINKYRLNIYKIREMRENQPDFVDLLISKLGDKNYVKNMKNQFRSTRTRY